MNWALRALLAWERALREEHGGHAAYDAEGSSLAPDAGLGREAVEGSARNQVEHLVEDDDVAAGWSVGCFHRPAERRGSRFLTSPFSSPPAGRL